MTTSAIAHVILDPPPQEKTLREKRHRHISYGKTFETQPFPLLGSYTLKPFPYLGTQI